MPPPPPSRYVLPKGVSATFVVARNDRTLTFALQPREKGQVEGDSLDCPRWDFTARAINQFANPDLYFHQQQGVFIYGVRSSGNAEQAGLRPDLLCLGKAMTAGYLAMSVTVASERLFKSFLGDDLGARTLYHGHSYGGNALAAAVALRHLELFEAWNVLENVRERSDELRALSELAHGHGMMLHVDGARTHNGDADVLGSALAQLLRAAREDRREDLML